MRNLPPIGAIIWARQIERQLLTEMYRRRPRKRLPDATSMVLPFMLAMIGPRIRKMYVTILDNAFAWSNIIAMLRKAAPPDLSSFMVFGRARNSPCLESESLERLSTFRSVRTLAITGRFLTSHTITISVHSPR